jgi:hypothetical protein
MNPMTDNPLLGGFANYGNPLGLYRNQAGTYATPTGQAYGSGTGWASIGGGQQQMWGDFLSYLKQQVPGLGGFLSNMPGADTQSSSATASSQLPAWTQASNPAQATQMWSDERNRAVYGDPSQWGVLASRGFPMYNDPRVQQDFAANTFGIAPQQFSAMQSNPWGSGWTPQNYAWNQPWSPQSSGTG